MKRSLGLVLVVALATATNGCGDATEAPRVDVPVVVDASMIETVTTDLGYEVELSVVRIAVRDVVFTIAGELDVASTWDRVLNVVIPSAYAHPGHYEGGDVTGELLGAHTIDWIADDGNELGVATLITGTYSAANFVFDRAGDDLDASDALVGHTAILEGVARRDGEEMAFTILIDSPEDRELVGAPFEATLTSTSPGPIRMRFHTTDPLEGDTLFDGIDFESLDDDGDGSIEIAPDVTAVEDAYNQLRRTFQTHDHYTFHTE